MERTIRFIRTSFFAARPWSDLEDLNRQALLWCETQALDRPWPQDPARSLHDVLAGERPRLLPLPANPYPVHECVQVKVGKTPYARFDGNDYSLPHAFVRRQLTVWATERDVRLLAGTEEVARHARSYDRGAQIEDPAHVQALIELKARGRRHRAMDRLAFAAPSSSSLLGKLAERGANLGQATLQLARLLNLYGAGALERALAEVLQGPALHVAAVRQLLERNRAAAGKPPATPLLPLQDHPQAMNLVVRPHDLAPYDALREAQEGRNDEHEHVTPG